MILLLAFHRTHAYKRYTSGTPNGQKISCTLEELGLKYDVHDIEISKNVQKEEWYLEINRESDCS